MSTRAVDAFAKRVLEIHSPECLAEPRKLDCVELWEAIGDEDAGYGVTSMVEKLPQGVEGRTWPDGRVVLDEETYAAALQGDGRARFTVTHEIMHGLKHAKQIQSQLDHRGGLRLNRKGQVPAFEDPEWQANTFAGAALMPAAMVRRLTNNCLEHCFAHMLSRTFGVSTKAARVRLDVIARHDLS